VKGRYRVYSTQPTQWGITKKGQLYFAKWPDNLCVKFHRWYDGVAMMIFTKDGGYGIKLRTEHVEALIAYLRGDIEKVEEIIKHRDDLEYLESLEEER